MQPDFDKSAAAMVAGTQKAIAKALGPVIQRIDALEARPAPERGEQGLEGAAGPAGKDGRGLAGGIVNKDGALILTLSDGTTQECGIVQGRDGINGLDGRDGIDGRNGLDGAKGIDGRDGIDGKNGTDGAKGIDGRDGVDGKDGRDGKDADPETVKALIDEVIAERLPIEVGKAVAMIPPPERGEKGERGESGQPGRDGVGVRDGFLQREGLLVLSLSDGTTRDLGVVVGKDGKDGADGLNGRDGADGKDGKDGSSLNLECPEDTSELVGKAMMALGEAFEPVWQYRDQPTEKQPIILNVNPPVEKPERVRKTITTRRDAEGNLSADVVEIAEE